MRDDHEDIVPFLRGMAQPRPHFRGGQGADLRGPETARTIRYARNRQFDHAQPAMRPGEAVDADVAAIPQIGQVDAAVPWDADAGQGAQRVVVRAEIPGAKGGDGRRARLFEQIPAEIQKPRLVGQGKIADIPALPPLHRRCLRPLQPFGMDMELDFMAALDDSGDDGPQEVGAVDKRGHRIEKEDALDAVTLHQRHLPAYAIGLAVHLAPYGSAQILLQPRSALEKRGGQFGIDGDAQHGHGRGESPGHDGGSSRQMLRTCNIAVPGPGSAYSLSAIMEIWRP